MLTEILREIKTSRSYQKERGRNMQHIIGNSFSWRTFSHQWWGLPLCVGVVLLSMTWLISPIISLPEGRCYLLYVPLAISVAMLIVFDWRAFPGIALGSLCHYIVFYSLQISLLMTLILLVSLLLSWLGYHLHVRNQSAISVGLLHLPIPRSIWLVLFLSLCFLLLRHLVAAVIWLPDSLFSSRVGPHFWTLTTLVNFQAMVLGIVLWAPWFYLLLRVLRRPGYLSVIGLKIMQQRSEGVSVREVMVWFIFLIASLLLLCIPGKSVSFGMIMFSDYSLALLFPVMLFAAVRYGYTVIFLVWPWVLLVLFFNSHGFINADKPDQLLQRLLFVSALVLVFTLSLLMLATSSYRQRRLAFKARQGELIDPVLRLPNLRALSQDLPHFARSVLCFIRIADLDVLSRHYGMQLRIEFKQRIAQSLRPLLQETEQIYHLPGYDFCLRLRYQETEQRIAQLDKHLRDFRLEWGRVVLQPSVGLAYCRVFSPVGHLHQLLGELSGIAEISLTTGQPETHTTDSRQIQLDIQRRVMLLHRIQKALDEDGFALWAQPIAGVRGDLYYEVLLRLPDAQGGMISPLDFLPVVEEFSLLYALDMWVARHTIQFIAQHRQQLPSIRLAINISPSSFCRSDFSQNIRHFLEVFQVQPYQLILEVTESQVLHQMDQAKKAMQELREHGCRIAIDDFGSGYASYDRFKSLQVDIIKIDGSFVRHMLTDAIDQQIIESICRIARMKHLSIVAEYVESEEQRAALHQAGVDYMQGYLIGQPAPIAMLLNLEQ
jgi:EAL domain-containing protein (putative c-di-GMP-specific phosphodiesterase class I)/GGDEF domain-containing protein